MSPLRVVAVVVTFNRCELLGEALRALAGQTHGLTQVVVVDNASTDQTPTLLSEDFPELDVVRLASNVGGAGGFAVGIRQALTHQPDLVWLMDDDTVPEPDAGARLLRAWSDFGDRNGKRPTLVASRVVWTDGRDHPMNTPRPKPGASRAQRRAATAVGCFPIRSASFVSVMCDAAVVATTALPVADYFLWNDDFEYSTRLLRGRVGLCCPTSVVVHKTAGFGGTTVDPGERFFYEVRNKVWTFTRSRGLNPVERLIYAGSTARRWLRTLAASRRRGVLLRAWVSGTWSGLVRPPRDTTAVLAEALPPAAEPDNPPAAEPFSLLMPVYAGDRVEFLQPAFRSSVHDQTRRPDEVVVVQDGPVGPGLRAALDGLCEDSPVPVRRVVLERNLGLGPALNAGLAACRHEVVARMDADDLSDPQRFARQLPAIEAGADIVGAGLWEFETRADQAVGRRTPQTDPDEIRRSVTWLDPFNHPTVVYRKSAVLRAGGYADLPLMEDYLLFARMLADGATPANLAEPLVSYRVGSGAYARRGGRRLLRSELALQRRLRSLGVTTRSQFWRNAVLRGGYRLVPESVRRSAYRRLIATRGARGADHNTR